MLACVDVAYHPQGAVAACLLFRSWTDAAATREWVQNIAEVEPYEPGQFYRRELPCLVAVLKDVVEPLEAVVVDGYVWLGAEAQPGLGAHLHAALQQRVAVVGVAKRAYAGSQECAHAVQRGHSRRPLFVTAVGMDVAEAAQQVYHMHGLFRIPTLLRRVDQLARRACRLRAS